MLIHLRNQIIFRYGSQANFSQIIKVDEAKVSRVINERKILSEAEKERWAEILRVSKKKLFKGN